MFQLKTGSQRFHQKLNSSGVLLGFSRLQSLGTIYKRQLPYKGSRTK